jgi:hypothetical protein
MEQHSRILILRFNFPKMSRFPDGNDFAFTVLDDTDGSTLEGIAPIYRLLRDLGIQVTKSVWPLANVPGAPYAGATLNDRDYLDFVLELKKEGFEISLHNVRNSDSPREVVEEGLEEFRRRLGEFPSCHANHMFNKDNLYWGSGRLSNPIRRTFYELATRFRYYGAFEGHLKNSPHFWGDICKRHITYVRNFVFDEINLDRVNATLPYRDPSKPFVNFWFSSCDGGDVVRFSKMLSEENQDRLEAEGGVCIMYTHFASGFCERGRVDTRVEALLRRLAKKRGWFVPVTPLLNHLRNNRTDSTIPPAELALMENRWFQGKLRTGSS